MKSNFRICPQCATRNRLDKEFCVKCGEPLEGVKAGDQTSAPQKGKPGFIVSDDEQGQNPIVPFFIVLLALAVGVGGWMYVRGATPVATAALPGPPQVQGTIPPAQIAPDAPGVKDYQLGVSAVRAGDFASAVKFFRLAVDAAQTNAVYRFALAEALDKSGSLNDALVEYDAAFQRDGRNLRYVTEWARALGRAGRSTDALRAYEAALVIEPNNLANLRDLANIYLKSPDLTRARPYLERIVELMPDDATQRLDLARTLEGLNELKAAGEQYQIVLTLAPNSDATRAQLAEVYMKENRSADALNVLDQGLATNASAALLYREKGRVLDRLGRVPEAIAAYQQYVRLSPGATDLQAFNTRIAELSAR